MKTIEEIRRTPVGLLSDDEISQLDPAGQEFAMKYKVRKAREDACPGHEWLGTSTREQSNRGDHRGHCWRCQKDMSYDSGD